MIYIGYRVEAKIPGIEKAPEIYAFYIERHLDKLGDGLVDQIRSLQRKATGEERQNTRYKVESRGSGGKMSFRLTVWNSKVQALVDETGAKPHFPPYKIGSDLWKWAKLKGLGQDISKGERRYLTPREARAAGRIGGKGTAAEHRELVDKQVERVSFLIARAISKRGLPRPGDPIRAPFKHVEALFRRDIEKSFTLPFALATARINEVNR